MKVDNIKTSAERHFKYFQREVPLGLFGQTNSTSFENYKWTVSVNLDVSNLVDLRGLLDQFPRKMSKILDQKLFTDFEFISSDGVTIPCHKAIISGEYIYLN